MRGTVIESIKTFAESHHTIVLSLLLMAIFLYGWFEGTVYERRDWACASWIMGILILTAWIVYPATAVRICLGAAVFVGCVVGMIIYYRRRLPGS